MMSAIPRSVTSLIMYSMTMTIRQANYQKQKQVYVTAIDIPFILRSHGPDGREYMEEFRFALLEQPSSTLYADRVDYCLKDLEFLSLAEASEIAATLIMVEGRIVVDSLSVARWLAYTYMEMNKMS